MKLGVQPLLAVGFAAAVLAVGIVALTGYRHFRDERTDIAWARHTDEVLTELDATLQLSTAAQSAVRGFAISGKDSFLLPQVEAHARLPELIRRIRTLTADNPVQQRRMPELQDSIQAMMNRQVLMVRIAREQGLAASQQNVNDGAGIAVMTRVREAIEAMKAEEQRLRPARWHAAELRVTESHATMTAMTALLLGLLVLCYVLVRLLFAIRREREAMLQRLAATLDQRVRERTAQLQVAQRHQAELAAIVETSNDAIVSVDGNWNFATWNQAAERLLGYTANEIIGCPVWTVIPPDRRSEMQGVVDRVRRGEGVGTFETVRRHKDGRSIAVAATASPIRDAMGRIIGASAILHDVAERKRLEAEVSHISDYEQQRLGRDLHDGIGQQLTAIELMLFQLQDQCTAAAASEQLDRIGDSLRATIRDVRTLARGLAPFILDETGLQTALTTLVSNGFGSRPQCRLVTPDVLPRIEQKVALQLYRIAQEALNNAVKHSGAEDVEIRLALDDHALCLEVHDNGAGLPPTSDLDAGIGLQIMRYRAELIGAAYELRSEPGGGVTVRCLVPLQP